MNTGTLTLEKIKIAEIQNISPRGFWIFDGEKEYFVSFKDYPDFYTATVQQINDFTVDAFFNVYI